MRVRALPSTTVCNPASCAGSSTVVHISQLFLGFGGDMIRGVLEFIAGALCNDVLLRVLITCMGMLTSRNAKHIHPSRWPHV